MYFFKSLKRKTVNIYKRNFCQDVIYHFGVFGNKINVGDTILYNKLEQITDIELGNKQKWYQRNLHKGEITAKEVNLINKMCKAVVIGGHGLLMVDSNKNKNSGWQFNISIENLKNIKVPIFVLAIGYNVFRNQKDFQPIFKDHISLMVSKSKVFALRNHGSIESLKNYLPEELHHKLRFQPCPTTVVSTYFNNSQLDINLKNKKIGICIAFDRFENRFGGKHEEIFESLVNYAKTFQEKGIEVEFFAHNRNEISSQPAQAFINRGFNIYPLYKHSEKGVYEYYKSLSLVLGMRGHSLMIPFGLEVPFISLTTQDKQKFFVETTGHMEWNIEMESDFEKDLIQETNTILNNYSEIKTELKRIQAGFVKETKSNYELIRQHI